jgi:hypothetical protein
LTSADERIHHRDPVTSHDAGVRKSTVAVDTPEERIMDYYAQEAVNTFLRAKRTTFINTEFQLQLDEDSPQKGRWLYVDTVAIDFHEKAVYLCEVTYAKTSFTALLEKVKKLAANWSGYCAALVRDAGVPPDWPVRLWLFVPKARAEDLFVELETMDVAPPPNRITPLEAVAQWTYDIHNRREDRCIPFFHEANAPECAAVTGASTPL